jgi:hypothetical protein
VRFTIEHRVGRLIEARVFNLPDVASVAEYTAGLQAAAAPLRDMSPVLLADHRPVFIYAPEVADALAGLFRGFNSVLTRAALIAAPTNATLNMQLGRLVREASAPWRRLFSDAAEAKSFLDEILSIEERRRAATFLGSFNPTPPTRVI